MKEALPTHAVSQQDYDRALFTLRSNQAQVAAAQANVETGKLNVDWCHVNAPIKGRIGRRLVTPGNLITGGAAQATLLTNITSLDPIYCYIDADEQAVLKYRRMAIEKQRVSAREAQIPCTLTLSDGSAYPYGGHIDFVSNRLDPATGTLQARGVFPNPERILEPGMFGRLRVAGSGPRRAVLVADQAVGTNQNQRYVAVVGPDNKVAFRPVTVGEIHDGLREVTAGLTGNERVVVEGLLRARPGADVAPTEVPMPTLRVITPSSTATTFPTTAPATRATTTPAGGRP
jgi:multidrug efflux system membrane fusion protein